jgi:hypothetical protein
MDTREELEKLAHEIVETFNIVMPPVPIAHMLKNPRPGMWDELDISQLSGTFLSIKEHFSPRMSMARMLVRHIALSPWGQTHGLAGLLEDDEALRAFARMLIMPRDMVVALSGSARNPTTMSMRFEVPEDDARQRLQELAPLF